MRRRAKASASLGFSRLIGPQETIGEGSLGQAKATDSREALGWVHEADIQAALRTLFKFATSTDKGKPPLG